MLSAVFAFARGFVREAFSVVAWGGAAAITLYGFGWAYDRVDPYVHNPLLSQVIAGFGLFVVSLIVLTMITGILARMVSMTAFSPIDRTLGFLFGLARGVFLVCARLSPGRDGPAAAGRLAALAARREKQALSQRGRRAAAGLSARVAEAEKRRHGSGAGRSGGRGKARDGRPGDPVRPRRRQSPRRRRATAGRTSANSTG